MGAKPKSKPKPKPEPKETHIYVKFFVTYPEKEYEKPVPRNRTAEVDVPIRKLDEWELNFLRSRIVGTWLCEGKPIPGKSGFAHTVVLGLTSTSKDAPWDALRDYLAKANDSQEDLSDFDAQHLVELKEEFGFECDGESQPGKT